MFTVRLIDTESGKPIRDKKVSVIFKGLFRGCARDQYTNSEGEADFTEDNGDGTIYVNGKAVYEGRIQGRKTIYL